MIYPGEDKRINDATVNAFLVFKTNIFHVVLRLFSNRSQKTPKWGTQAVRYTDKVELWRENWAYLNLCACL